MAENKPVSVEEMGVNICVPVTKTTAERLNVYNPALATVRYHSTMKTCPWMQYTEIFSAVKENFIRKILMFLIFFFIKT